MDQIAEIAQLAIMSEREIDEAARDVRTSAGRTTRGNIAEWQ